MLPVIEGIRAGAVPLSIDTSKAAVAEPAIRAGASMVNDVTALGDPAMADLVASLGVDVCLMHMLGTPRTMQETRGTTTSCRRSPTGSAIGSSGPAMPASRASGSASTRV